MASTNNFADRLGKLGGRLDKINAQIETLTYERENILQQIQEFTNGGSVGHKTITTPKKSTGKLGDKILAYMQANPGTYTSHTLATKMRTTAGKIGVSLYHLVTAGLVNQNGNDYSLPSNSAPESNTAITV